MAFCAWHHAIFCVAKAKIARGTGHCHAMVQRIATHGKKYFPRHDIATRVVLAIARHGVLDIATHETISTQGYCVIQYHAWLKG